MLRPQLIFVGLETPHHGGPDRRRWQVELTRQFLLTWYRPPCRPYLPDALVLLKRHPWPSAVHGCLRAQISSAAMKPRK
jgi:hypothetical protein